MGPNNDLSIVPYTHREVWASLIIKGTSLQQAESTENHNQSKFRVVGKMLQRVFTKKVWGTLEERVEDCEGWKIMEFAVRLCLLIMSEATNIMSHLHDPRHKLNKDNNRQVKWMAKSPRGYTKNFRQRGMLRMGEIKSSPGKNMPTNYPLEMVSPENTQEYHYGDCLVLIRDTYTCTDAYMHVTTITVTRAWILQSMSLRER